MEVIEKRGKESQSLVFLVSRRRNRETNFMRKMNKEGGDSKNPFYRSSFDVHAKSSSIHFRVLAPATQGTSRTRTCTFSTAICSFCVGRSVPSLSVVSIV